MSSKPAGFSRPCQRNAKAKKPPESSGFSLRFRSVEDFRLEPLAPAAMFHATAATPIAVIAVPVVAPTPAAEPAHMGQDGQPAFLAVVEGLVERVSRVSDLLHRRRRGRHGVGA